MPIWLLLFNTYLFLICFTANKGVDTYKENEKRPFSLSFTYGKIQFMMPFEIISKITDVETIAKGSGIDEIAELRATYGGYNWRKKKGIATVRFINGDIRIAEVHWYECHGIGRRKEKVKKVIRK